VCPTLYCLLPLGVLLPQCAYRNLEAVATAVKASLSDSVIKPDNLIFIQGYADTLMPPLEGGTMFPFRPFIYHQTSNDLEDYKRLCARVCRTRKTAYPFCTIREMFVGKPSM